MLQIERKTRFLNKNCFIVKKDWNNYISYLKLGHLGIMYVTTQFIICHHGFGDTRLLFKLNFQWRSCIISGINCWYEIKFLPSIFELNRLCRREPGTSGNLKETNVQVLNRKIVAANFLTKTGVDATGTITCGIKP